MNKKPNKLIYKAITTNSIVPTAITKWNYNVNYNIDTKDVFNICFNITKDPTIQWLQYRIINRILPTRKYLKKIKVTNCDLCSFCDHDVESIEHMFFDCDLVSAVWNNLEYIIYTNTNIIVHFDKKEVLFGRAMNDENLVINFLTLYTKHYIYINSKQSKNLSMNGLLNHLKVNYECHKYMALKSYTVEKFNDKWNVWKELFT